MGKTIGGIVKVVAGVAIGALVPGIGIIIGGAIASSGLKDLGVGPRKPKASPSSINRLNVSFDPGTPRKIVYGRTALATDLRYSGFTGTDQEYYHQILCVASHEVEAIEELWFDSELAWSSSGGVASKFSGYLTVTARTVGTSANGIAIDSVWTSAATLTGCAYLHVRYKLTGNSKKAESPFAQQIPTRVTVRGKGAKVYDPRLDTTVGGSGAHRSDTQTTWEYATAADSGRNPALQLLHYLIGYRINSVLAVGRGVPVARLDLDSFITGANLCDEAVTKAVGGTEPRYRHDGIFSEADDPGAVIASLCASMNAVLRDAGGRISLDVLHNDLASPVVELGADDILGDELLVQTVSLDETPNVIRGRYTDPSDAALYQLVDYPEVSLTSQDGIDRIETFDLPGVQSASQAQRLAKQRLQRLQYRGVYSAKMGHRAWQASQGRIVAMNHPTLGWADKLFRCEVHTVDPTGVVQLVLREENAAIYAWDAEESAAVTPTAPTTYDPLLSPIVGGIDEAGGTADWSGIIDDDGNKPEDDADVTHAVGGPAEIVIECDYEGNPLAGQLPREVAYRLSRSDGTQVTTGVTWARTVETGTGTTAISGTGTGTLEITDLATDLRIKITASANSRTYPPLYVTVRRNLAAPPSGGGGSGNPGTGDFDTTIASTASSSYGTANAGPMTVKAGTAGQVNLSAPLSFTRATSSTGTSGAFGKWQWRVVAGSWADVASESSSSASAETIAGGGGEPGESSPGSISVNTSKTGLTAGTDYEFQLLLRGSSAVGLNYVGTATATGV